MGGKLSCLPCQKSRRRSSKRSRIFPTTLNNNRLETRTSSEILQELQELGFVQEAAKAGGITFVVDPVPDAKSRAPRRLPALSSDKQKSDPMTGETTYNKDAKDTMVEIRRIGALTEKGKMARQSEERRKKVLERREAKRRNKIVKTKEKLKKENERLEIQTPDIKPKRPSYEERRKRVLERRKQIALDKNAKITEVDDGETVPVIHTRSEPVPVIHTRSEPEGLPDVST